MMEWRGAIISDDTPQAGGAESRDIYLPHQKEHVSQLSVDIGGSLAKVVYFSRRNNIPGGRLNFIKFETQQVEECIDFIQRLLKDGESDEAESSRPPVIIKATGGGAHLFYNRFRERLGLSVQQEDEMECLITGLNFFISEIPYEVFTYSENDPMRFEETAVKKFPYMLVQIGSGVSVLKVTGEKEFERISGTSLGGGTLWGLLSMLTEAQSFDEMLELSKKGDNHNVDMLVGDIYGADGAQSLEKIGLSKSTIASSFGKVFKKGHRNKPNAFRPEDISRSLLYMVSNNIGQIAYLNAKQHGLERIYFGGCFVRGHPITMNTLSYAINFWSKGKMKALFLRHEGYLGAVGAFLRHEAPKPQNGGSFRENFTHTSSITEFSVHAHGNTLDRMPNTLIPFPQLVQVHPDGALYDPDTFNISHPEKAAYWLDALENNLSGLISLAMEWRGKYKMAEGGEVAEEKGVINNMTRTTELGKCAIESEMVHEQMESSTSPINTERTRTTLDPTSSYATRKAPAATLAGTEAGTASVESLVSSFETLFRNHLGRLRSSPTAYGSLSVRFLLNLREQCLQEMGFTDIFVDVKREENDAALQALKAVLEKLDTVERENKGIPEGDENIVKAFVNGVLAGNMFDWGAAQIFELLRAGNLDFESAHRRVGHHPKFDNMYDLVERMRAGIIWRKACIFVDNSGADIVLGVLPFARFLLSRGTKVVLAANSYPALNDITNYELVNVLNRVASIDPLLGSAWKEQRLIVLGSGSAGPCIDLRRVDEDLARECADVDLVVLEGMGRAIHTNYRARFRCDSLKIAVFKNEEAARMFNVKMYDALVLFEPAFKATDKSKISGPHHTKLPSMCETTIPCSETENGAIQTNESPTTSTGIQSLLTDNGLRKIDGIDLQLHRVKAVLEYLDNPQDKVPAFHVAGTNGKGSVCAYLAHILHAAGYRAGRYLSPHMLEPRDAIRFENGLPPTQEEYEAASAHTDNVIRELLTTKQLDEAPTEFEKATISAFQLFASRKLDFTIVEVGLGGRFDATNVFAKPAITIITSIGIDHTAFLGTTVADIASHKAGIYKADVPVVIAPQREREAEKELLRQAKELQGCPDPILVRRAQRVNIRAGYAEVQLPVIVGASAENRTRRFEYPVPLLGDVQLENSATALTAIELLRQTGVLAKVDDSHIIQGMEDTRWPGRLDLIPKLLSPIGISILVDGAHNPAAAKALGMHVETEVRAKTPTGNVHWIIGLAKGKDTASILELLLRPGDSLSAVPFTRPEGMTWITSLPQKDIAQTAIRMNLIDNARRVESYENLQSALEAIKKEVGDQCAPPIVLCGSLYLVADMYRLTLKENIYTTFDSWTF